MPNRIRQNTLNADVPDEPDGGARPECLREWGDVTAFRVERAARRENARGDVAAALKPAAPTVEGPAEVVEFPVPSLPTPRQATDDGMELLRAFYRMSPQARALLMLEAIRLSRY